MEGFSRDSKVPSNRTMTQSGKVLAPAKGIFAGSFASEVSDKILLQQTLHLDMNPLRVEPDLFRDEADYERVVNSVAARIRAGEIEACQPKEDQ